MRFPILFSGVQLENIEASVAAYFIRENVPISTEVGWQPARDHLEDHHEYGDRGHYGLYRCSGCQAVVCWCNGSGDDERCDSCSVSSVDSQRMSEMEE